MVGLSAILFVPDDTAKTGYCEPMMLHSILGAPVLTWLTQQLCAAGVGRFFLVCGDRYLARAKACLPAEAEVMTTESEAAADLLHVFLSTAEENERVVTVVAAPALYLPDFAERGTKPSCVFSASREALMEALDGVFSFSEFLREKCAVLGAQDGFFPVSSPRAAMELADLLRKSRMLELERGGVTVYDPSNCYAEPSVVVEPGAVLLPGTILRGKTVVREGAVVGPNTQAVDSEIGTDARVTASHLEQAKVGSEATVGPFAHLRPGTEIKRGAHVGNFVELKNTTLGEYAFASHLSYLGDAQIGDRVNLGCGTVTVNFDRVEKSATVVGADAFVGCQSALIAPVRIGNGAYVAAGTVVTEDVPDQALAIGRARQSNKKEWAAKHKRP